MWTFQQEVEKMIQIRNQKENILMEKAVHTLSNKRATEIFVSLFFFSLSKCIDKTKKCMALKVITIMLMFSDI